MAYCRSRCRWKACRAGQRASCGIYEQERKARLHVSSAATADADFTASRRLKWSKTPFTKCNAMNRDQLVIVRSYLGQAAAVVTAALAVWGIAYLFGSNAYWSLFLLAVWVGLCARVFDLIARQRASLMQSRKR